METTEANTIIVGIDGTLTKMIKAGESSGEIIIGNKKRAIEIENVGNAKTVKAQIVRVKSTEKSEQSTRHKIMVVGGAALTDTAYNIAVRAGNHVSKDVDAASKLALRGWIDTQNPAQLAERGNDVTTISTLDVGNEATVESYADVVDSECKKNGTPDVMIVRSIGGIAGFELLNRWAEEGKELPKMIIFQDSGPGLTKGNELYMDMMQSAVQKVYKVKRGELKPMPLQTQIRNGSDYEERLQVRMKNLHESGKLSKTELVFMEAEGGPDEDAFVTPLGSAAASSSKVARLGKDLGFNGGGMFEPDRWSRGNIPDLTPEHAQSTRAITVKNTVHLNMDSKPVVVDMVNAMVSHMEQNENLANFVYQHEDGSELRLGNPLNPAKIEVEWTNNPMLMRITQLALLLVAAREQKKIISKKIFKNKL